MTKQLLRFQKKLASLQASDRRRTRLRAAVHRPVPRLLFEVFSQRYERGSTLVTTNLPFDEWTEVFGIRAAYRRSPRPPHPTTEDNILEMNGESYRLNQSRRRQTPTAN